MIRIDALWLCAQPVDMRAGAERLLAAVVATVGQAHAHHGYLFANARATRVKLLVHDGFGHRISGGASCINGPSCVRQTCDIRRVASSGCSHSAGTSATRL